MDAATLASLQRLQTEAHALSKAINSITHRLDALIAHHAKGAAIDEPPDWKRPDGRLSDAGITAMEAMLAEGRTVTEIAKAFHCTVSAASHRKRIWQAKGATT